MTLRDPSDLVGLSAIPLLWYWLGRCRDSTRTAAPWPTTAPGIAVPQRQQRAPLAAPVGGAFVALLALTATSPVSRPEVIALRTMGSTVYAEIDQPDSYGQSEVWAVSDDGGHQWRRLEGAVPAGAVEAASKACRSDGHCFQAVGHSIGHRAANGDLESTFTFNKRQRAVIDYRRFDEGASLYDLFTAVAVVDQSGTDSVVVSARDQGVVVVGADGHWQRVQVLGARPTPMSGTMIPFFLAEKLLFFSLPIAVFTVVLSLATKTGSVWRRLGNAIGTLVAAGALWGVGMLVWAIGTFNRVNPMTLAALIGGAALMTIGLPLINLRQGRSRAEVTPSAF